MGQMLQELRGYKSLCKGELHSYKIQLRLKLSKDKKLYWQKLSHLHLQWAEEIKAQSEEVKQLSTLLRETANYPGTGPGTIEE